jgi:YVTN family beta-propeller protein
VIAPDGRLAYLADSCASAVDIVDLRAGAFLKFVPVPGFFDVFNFPTRFALAHDGTRLYVPLIWEPVGSIAVLDTVTATVTERISFLPDLEVPEPIALALGSGDQSLYVLLQAGNGTLPVLDTASHTVTDVLVTDVRQATGTALAVTPDDSQLLVANGPTLDIIDTHSKVTTAVALDSPASGPGALALTPDGAVAYVTHAFIGAVSAVDVHARLVAASIPVGEQPRDIAVGRINGPCRPPGYTPQPTATATPTPTVTPTKVPVPQCPEGLPCLSVSSATGRAGDDLSVAVRLHSAGRTIGGTQNDILWDSGVSLHHCTAGGPSVRISTSYSASSVRALVFGDSGQPIADGTVLYTCTLTIAKNAAVGTYYLRTVGLRGTDPAGNPVNVVGADGTVVVVDQTDPQPQTGTSPAGGGCAIGGRIAAQWLFSLTLLLPPLSRLLRSLGLRRSR